MQRCRAVGGAASSVAGEAAKHTAPAACQKLTATLAAPVAHHDFPRTLRARGTALSTTHAAATVVHSAWKQQRRGFAQRVHFDGFPFGGGFPGATGAGPPKGDSDKYYRLLGIERNADEAAIKSAYKKQAMKHHPDRGGDEATFKEISKAYEVLSDSEKRQLYDMYGEEGLDGMNQGGGGAPHGMDPFDMFSSIFGFNPGGQRTGPRGRRVTDDSVYEMQLSLEDLYRGTRRDIVFNRDAVCTTCDGRGGHDVRQCGRCRGTGVQVTFQQMGMMVQQIQSPCSACGGKGFSIPRESICKDCQGKGIVKQRKTFSVDVEAGAADGSEFRFRGQADEKPGFDAGDVVIVVREKPHKTFQRIKQNLVMSKTISLSEALCGFQFETTFLDGEELVIRSKPGEVSKPGDMMRIEGKGMPRPHKQRPGDLFLHLQVAFPKSLSADQQEGLLHVLNGKAVPEEPPLKSVTAKKLTAREEEELNRRHAEASREQENRRRGGQQVGCQQQ